MLSIAVGMMEEWLAGSLVRDAIQSHTILLIFVVAVLCCVVLSSIVCNTFASASIFCNEAFLYVEKYLYFSV